MPALKLAVSLRGLRLPLKKALSAAAHLGVQAVEIDGRGEINPQDITQTGVRQIKKLCEDLRLSVSAVEFRTRRGYYAADELSRRIEATKAAMKLAASLGARLVVNQVGRVPDDEASPDWQTLVEVLADLGAYGQHIGALLAAETGSEDASRLRKLLDALPTGSLVVALNPGNLIINGFAPLDAVELLASEIAYVRAKDGVRDLAQGRGIEVQLGRGSADLPALLGALEQRGYRGSICVAGEPGGDPVEVFGQAVEYLRSL
jgi:sugar phosphate isomerase/epimerase